MAHVHRCTLCGGVCRGDNNDHSTLHLHVEIENLKQKLLERENHIVTMETNFLTEVDKFPNGEFAAVTEELVTWQEKYSRLFEAHKRIQKVNQNLEDKLLKIVDKCETEKFNMAKEVISLKERLIDANASISSLKDENERTRNDVNIAIQLLQCKPSNFVSQKFESLPSDLQQKVKVYMANKKKPSDAPGQVKHEVKTIKVPIPTFPPTAMFYSVNKSNREDEEDEESDKSVDIVSAAIVAKILEEREKERQNIRHCDSCICPSRRNARNTETQTAEGMGYSLGDAGIIRVESYQSPLPTVSSVTLIERSATRLANQTNSAGSHTTAASAPPTSRRPEGATTTLNLGRNRYHSSKLSREVNRRRDKSDQDHPTLRHSEIHIDDSGEVSCDIADVRLTYEKETGRDEEYSRKTGERRNNVGIRKCSVSIHSGSTADGSASCVPTSAAKANNSYAFLHSSRSSSTSSMEDKPTETQI